MRYLTSKSRTLSYTSAFFLLFSFPHHPLRCIHAPQTHPSQTQHFRPLVHTGPDTGDTNARTKSYTHSGQTPADTPAVVAPRHTHTAIQKPTPEVVVLYMHVHPTGCTLSARGDVVVTCCARARCAQRLRRHMVVVTCCRCSRNHRLESSQARSEERSDVLARLQDAFATLRRSRRSVKSAARVQRAEAGHALTATRRAVPSEERVRVEGKGERRRKEDPPSFICMQELCMQKSYVEGRADTM